MHFSNFYKFNYKKYKNLVHSLSKCIFNSVFELERNAKIVKINNENLLATSFVNKNNTKITHLYNLPKHINYSNVYFRNLNDEQIQFLQDGGHKLEKRLFLQTYFYNTQKFVNRSLKSKDVKRFTKKYTYKIFEDYDLQKVRNLFYIWNSNLKERGKDIVSEELFDNLIDEKYKKKYKISSLFFEINGVLVGVKFVYPFTPEDTSLLVMRLQCSLYEYYGLGQFMSLKVAEKFSEYKEFTDGGEFVGENFDSRRQYKLLKRKPDRIEDLYYVKVL